MYNDYSLKILFPISGKYVRNPTLAGGGGEQSKLVFNDCWNRYARHSTGKLKFHVVIKVSSPPN